MFDLIEISQGIKTFVLKALLGKPFQTFYYYSLKNLFEKTILNSLIFLERISLRKLNIKILFFFLMQACLHKMNYKVFIKIVLQTYDWV
jgi:hypothetical protein